MLALYSLALLVGAALLFVLQPMVAKMVLPLFGGAPAVWNTCMLFFQAALLAGYAYAHWAPHRLGPRRHAGLHLVLLLAAVALLPISISAGWAPLSEIHPALWLLWLLLAVVGLPFFLLSATAPLVQRWFTLSSHAAAGDPYFLYTASNFGSMVALLSYPFLLEPNLTLEEQSWLWLSGYVLLIVLLLGCAVFLWRSPVVGVNSPVASVLREGAAHAISEGRGPLTACAAPSRSAACAAPSRSADATLTWPQRLRWLALAFVPSSLMLSVTTFLTTDIAAFPLLWVIPLALYLFTFILAFASRPLIPHWLVQRVMPITVLVVTILLLSEATTAEGFGIWPVLAIHLSGLFVVALACHGELARTRPDARHLTEFYLWLSAGGVLGGAVNALLAPLLFSSVAEYPLVLIVACFLRAPPAKCLSENSPLSPWERGGEGEGRAWHFAKRKTNPSPQPLSPKGRGASEKPHWATSMLRHDLLPALLLGGLSLCLVFGSRAYLRPTNPHAFRVLVGLSFGLPAVICYTFVDRPLRFGFGIAALFFAGQFTEGIYGQRIYAERSFFGIHRITRDPTGRFYRLIHGNTIHGQQNIYERDEPLTYYHKKSPIGRTFAALARNHIPLKEVGVVGLGVGSLAAYAKPGQIWTFFEIDPVVVKIARDQGLFTYWQDAQQRGVNLSVVLGDARLKLQALPEKKFDLLIIDAFNSDSVPAHLLTREALQVYLERLTPNGILAFHISNRYLDLTPVLAELSTDGGLRCLSWFDNSTTEQEQEQEGKFKSHWVLMGRAGSPLAQIKKNAPWEELHGGNPHYLWTDQFSNIFSVMRWKDQ